MPTGVTPPPPAADPPPWSASLGTICQLTIRSTWNTVQMVNVHHFMATSSQEASFDQSGDAGRQQWGQDIITSWQGAPRTALLAGHHTSFVLAGLSAQVLEVPGELGHRLGPVLVSDTGAGTAGTGAGAQLQAHTAIVVRWKTLQAKRTTRGRTYFGGWTSDEVDAQKVTFAGQTAVQSYINALLAMFTGASVAHGAYLVIYSRPYRLQEWTTSSSGVLTVWGKAGYGGTATPVTVGAIDTNARVQRRREVGVGI